MSTVHAAPRVPIQKSVPTVPFVPSVPTAPAGSTAVTAPGGRRRGPLVTAVRNLGIALDTAARVVFLGRDGVRY